MTYNILLICQNGASTTILVEKMISFAKMNNIDVIINAYPENQLGAVIKDADLVLLAPQIRHKRKVILEKYQDLNIPFLSIEPMDYGMMDGEKVLTQALNELNQ